MWQIIARCCRSDIIVGSLADIQEKLGALNSGIVYAVFDYRAQNSDELNFNNQDKLAVLRKGDETEQEWWWAKKDNREGYIPRNLLGVSICI